MVTILIPVHNSENFLREAIESVLMQTYTNFELLLINDGSTDSSLNIIRQYAKKDLRITFISHRRKGMAKTLNDGLHKAKYELIIRMDADDVMLPMRVKRQLDYMSDHKEITVASCLAYYINSKGKKIGKTYSDLKNYKVGQRYYKENKPIGLLHPGVIFRKKDIIDAGGYRSKFWPAEDIDLWNRLIEKGKKIVVMQEILLMYRIHISSAVTSSFFDSRMKYEWLRECMLLRRKGREEISWDEFFYNQNKLPLNIKLNNTRKRFSKYFYRSAGFSYSTGKNISFILRLTLAFLLQPICVLKKIARQKI